MNLREALLNSADYLHQNYLYPKLTEGPGEFDREIPHEKALALMENWVENSETSLYLLDRLFTFHHPLLRVKLWGKSFRNPLGVSAGFDKNARVYHALGAMGFGHIEVGSITRFGYKGNARPRIRALPEDEAVLNRMGFPGDGDNKALHRLIRKEIVRKRPRNFALGINIGASMPSFLRGRVVSDSLATHVEARDMADYYVDNISSPNTPGVRGLQEPAVLDELLSATDYLYSPDQQGNVTTPRLIKIAPDLSWEQLDTILDVAVRHNVHGVIATNTTTSPEIKASLRNLFKEEPGGISGKPLTARAREVTKYIYDYTEGKLPIIRAGGVMDWKDYYEAITHGASLVQIYTALVNKATSCPSIAYRFNRELVRFMTSEGIKSLDEVRGSGLQIGEVYEDYFG